MDAILCTVCGRQVEQLQGTESSQQPQIVINNANNNVNTNTAIAAGAERANGYAFSCGFSWDYSARISFMTEGSERELYTCLL